MDRTGAAGAALYRAPERVECSISVVRTDYGSEERELVTVRDCPKQALEINVCTPSPDRALLTRNGAED